MKRARATTNTAIDLLLVESEDLPVVEEQIVDDYKKLGEKVDTVISKIKNRKNNRKSKQN